jgi:chemotaxis protein CheZ
MMASPSDNPELQKQLAKLQTQGESVNPAEITAIVESIMSKLAGDLTAADLKLYTELEQLARFIQNARSEIAAVRPHDINSEDIPRATDELDAVVGATEEATGTILDACEQLEKASAGLPPEAAEAITNAVTRIYEACNFQDITGQRITKVVKTLKHIEDRVSAMLTAFGGEIAKHQGGAAPAAAPAVAKPNDAELLNGPQMPDDAKKQAEIDAILASFDR